MRWYEHMFWVSLFWALYLPVSLIIQWILGQGTVLGILAIGAFFSVCLSVIAEIIDLVLFSVVFRPRPVLSAERVELPTPKPKTVRKKRVRKVKEVKQDEQPKTEQPKIRTDVDLSNLDFLQ